MSKPSGDRHEGVLYEVLRPTRTSLARSAPASWAWGASRRLGGEVSSQHISLTWSRRELRATRESGWLRWVPRAPRSRAKGAGRPFWHFGAAMATSPGRIATPRGRVPPWRHGEVRGIFVSTLGWSMPSLYGPGRGRVPIARLPHPPSWCAQPATPPDQIEGTDATRGPGRPERRVVVTQGHRGRPAAGSRRRSPSYKFTSTRFA